MPVLRAGLAIALACTIGLEPTFGGASSQRASTATPRVVVWPIETDAAQGEQAVRAAGFELVDHGPLEAAIEAAARSELARRRERASAVQAGLDAAQQAWLEQRFTDMVTQLSTLQHDALPILATDAYCSTLWELQFRMALGLRARAREGDLSRAEDRLAFAVALEPDRVPDRALFGPDVAQAYVAAAEAVRRRPPQPFELHVDPPDANVRVDCRSISNEQAALALRPGLHVVHVTAPGAEPWAAIVDTRTDARLEVSLPQVGDPVEGIGRSLAQGAVQPTATFVGALARAAEVEVDADAVLVLFEVGEQYVAQVVTTERRGRRARAQTRSAAVSAALLWLDERGNIRVLRPEGGSVTIGIGTVEVRRGPPSRKAWVWGTIGGVAAIALALGLGLGLGLGRDDGSTKLDLTFR